MSKRPASVLGILLLSLAPLASCTSLVGKESAGRYTAPDGLFSLPVPELGLGSKIEDRIATDPKTGMRFGAVSFLDDFAQVRAIEFEQIPPGFTSTEETLHRSLDEVKLNLIRQFSPKASVAREESVRLPDGTLAWFGVVEVPEGSTVVVRSSEHPDGRRLDSTRGFLHLSRDNLFLSLSAADDFRHEEGATGSAEDYEKLKGWLVALYSSMKFP